MINANTVKNLIGATAVSKPLKPVMLSVFRSKANIVYYHFAGETEPFYKEFSGHCSLGRFEQDLVLLKSYFDIVPLEWIFELNRNGKSPPKPVLSVTFDDGFNLVRGGVMDVLDRHGVKATVFLITSCVDNQNLMWRNKLSAIKNSLPPESFLFAYNRVADSFSIRPAETDRDIFRQSMQWSMREKETLIDALWLACDMPPLSLYLKQHLPYMSWSDVEMWRSKGHGIGLHTHTHPVCAELEKDQVVAEIIEPAAFLKQRFDLEDIPFSYPFGIRLPKAVEKQLVDSRTIQCACGIQGGVPFGTPLHRLERVGIEASVRFPLFGKAIIKSTGLF